ncbi:protein of unknown function (plasmid) [Caballeronia sp. S22]
MRTGRSRGAGPISTAACAVSTGKRVGWTSDLAEAMKHIGNSSDYWVKRQWKWAFCAKQRGMVGQKSQFLAPPLPSCDDR